MAVEVAEVPLSHVAHNLLFRYARWFLRKHRRTGHLFERRYRAFLVESDRALRSLIRYIHLNPVRAEIVDRPQTYPWSSYSAYIAPDSHSPSWLTQQVVFSLFGERTSRARAALRAFTEAKDPDPTEEDEHLPVLDGAVDLQSDKSAALNGHVAGAGAVACGETTDEVLEAVTSACAIDLRELRADVKTRTIVRARALASLLVRESPRLTLRELGAALGRDASTLSRAAYDVERRAQLDPELRERIEKLRHELGRH